MLWKTDAQKCDMFTAKPKVQSTQPQALANRFHSQKTIHEIPCDVALGGKHWITYAV